jgi:pilus assembly protein Flp/PilA
MPREQDRGASAVEYGLMVAAIAGVLAVVVFSLGTVVRNSFEKHSSCLSSQLQSQPCS